MRGRRIRPVIIGIVLIGLAVVVVRLLSQQSQDPTGNLGPAEDLGRIAQNDRALPRLEQDDGGAVFSETVDAAQGTTITLEIPPGMTVYVRGAVRGGSVDFIVNPNWTDPAIVGFGEGSPQQALISNESEHPGKVAIRATPIGEVSGEYTIYAE